MKEVRATRSGVKGYVSITNRLDVITMRGAAALSTHTHVTVVSGSSTSDHNKGVADRRACVYRTSYERLPESKLAVHT